jgi:hypothetical protein
VSLQHDAFERYSRVGICQSVEAKFVKFLQDHVGAMHIGFGSLLLLCSCWAKSNPIAGVCRRDMFLR